MSNIEQNRAHNFSGRSFSKKSSEELYNDIIHDFENVLKELDNIQKYAFDNFCFEKKVDELINILEKQNNINLEEIRRKYECYNRNLMASKNLLIFANRKADIIKEKEKNQVAFDYMQVQNIRTKEFEKEILDYKKDILEYENQIEDLQKQLKVLDTELLNIKNSRAWKIISKIRSFITINK